MRPVPSIAIEFIASEEEEVLRVYDDADPKKVLAPGDKVLGRLTAGFGHTGDEITIGMDVTHDMALAWLDQDAATAAGRICQIVIASVVADLTDHQYAALISFVFNLGADPKWTIWKRLNARQFDQVPLELMKFVNACVDGKEVKVQGLVNRRAAEVAFWATEEPGTISDTPPSSVTRAAVTPPTPQDPTPPSRTKTVMAGAVATAAAVPGAVSKVSDAIEPYAHHSETVRNMLAALATIGAIAAGAVVLFAYLHNKKTAS